MADKDRLWLPALSTGRVTLDAERAHYVINVLRLRPGDRLTVLSGEGQVGRATIIDPEALDVGPLHLQSATRAGITVATAVPKGERADWVVEKLTELGAERLIWITCTRSVVSPREGGNRMARWQRLAEAGAKQSARARTLAIEGPVPLPEVLRRSATARLIAEPAGAPLVSPGRDLSQALLLVGPEGGFTSDELLQAHTAGYAAVSLGPWILRVETAAVAGTAVLAAMSALEEPT